jgi:Family of unknown function (DUF6308)
MSSEDLRARIRAIVASPADKLLVAFFDPAEPFDGGMFDTLPDNPRDTFSAGDLLAQTMLDVVHKPLAVRALLKPGFSRHLADVRDDLDLWDANDQDLAPAYRLWDEFKALPGVGPTMASKLLARKRPRLIPIVDSVVRRSYGLTEHDDSWVALREVLKDRQLRDQIDAIRPPGLTSTVSTLRLLDVAAWMRDSGSRNAKRVRKELGL